VDRSDGFGDKKLFDKTSTIPTSIGCTYISAERDGYFAGGRERSQLVTQQRFKNCTTSQAG
jgi:hypothetical protein